MKENIVELLTDIKEKLMGLNELKEVEFGIINESEYKVINKQKKKRENNHE